jgi:hypothetical protein
MALGKHGIFCYNDRITSQNPMNTTITRAGVTLVAAVTLSVLMISGVAADGAKSMDKYRTPQQVYIHKKGSRPMKVDISHAKIAPSQNEALARYVRKKARLQKLFLANKGIHLTQPVHASAGKAVDREYLVLRNHNTYQLACAKLHTHERAICYRDNQQKRASLMERLLVGKK